LADLESRRTALPADAPIPPQVFEQRCSHNTVRPALFAPALFAEDAPESAASHRFSHRTRKAFMTIEYIYADHLPADFSDQSLRADVLTGLTAPRKWLPPKWFYDKVGSELFEDITRLPEYYPTRTERSILTRHAGEIIDAAGTTTLVELGSGSSAKTTLLLDALVAQHPTDAAYVALDVSEDALRSASAGLVAQYPQLAISALRADFTHQLHLLPTDQPRTVAFLGSTIGNFDPAERTAFLGELRARMDKGDNFLLGADLVKPPDVLIPAYDDAAGVTAEFNLNVLEVLNHRLGANFDRRLFRHRAVWDSDQDWIEMRLQATRSMVVEIPSLALQVAIDRDEEIRTEISAKFRPETLTAELRAAGLRPRGWWTDEQEWFSLSLWGTG
jgi:L-histidine N-alpha-methyltransferase